MWFRVLLAGTFAGLLSACAVIDPVDSRYDTVGRSLARARDEAIFLNLVRASHDYPLSFTTVSNVTPIAHEYVELWLAGVSARATRTILDHGASRPITTQLVAWARHHFRQQHRFERDRHQYELQRVDAGNQRLL